MLFRSMVILHNDNSFMAFFFVDLFGPDARL